MTFDWSADSASEFFLHFAVWLLLSIVQAGIEWLEGGFGKLPVSGVEGIALAVGIAVGLLWVIIRLIKMIAVLTSLGVTCVLAVRFVAL